jgi:hypothetical protein
VVAITAGIAAAALLLAHGIDPHATPRPRIFEYLFARDEPAAALLSCVLILFALALSRRPAGAAERVVGALSRDPRAFIAGFVVVCAAATLLVYRAHPLSMDEYAPLFQANAFAHGSLTGKVPPQLVSRLIPPARWWFIEASPSGNLISAYWPGFALLLTPFAWLGCPWLLNPLIGGASLALLWHLARELRPGTDAPGWAVLLAAASPAFVVDAISGYSISAHLLANLGFAALLLRPEPRRLLAAGAVGSLAFTLTNPLPHVLFAVPFMAWLALRPGRVRSLAMLALGYLPGILVLFGGWLLVRAQMHHAAPGASGPLGIFGAVSQAAFAGPTRAMFWNRGAGLVELVLWASPGLIPLAVMGYWTLRQQPAARVLAASAVLTLAAYFFVAFDQGHGWGYRYFHSAWGTLPLFAACALTAPEGASLRRLAAVAALGSLVLGNGLRFAQVRTFIDGHLAQIPRPPQQARLEIVFIRADRGYYSQDLVQDDPFLEGRRWVLFSHGPQQDEEFMQRAFPGARLAASGEVASVWQLD